MMDSQFVSKFGKKVNHYGNVSLGPLWSRVRPRLRGRRIRSSKPDFIEDPPCMWARRMLNHTSWVERPSSGLHVGRKLTQYQVGSLICDGLNKSATVGNAPWCFKVTDIFPFNNNALPDNLFYLLEDSEVPVPENTTQEERNSSSEVLINTPQINLQPAEPGTSSVKPPSPTKHLHKISPIPRLSQVTAKDRIKKAAVLLTSIDNRNALKANLEKRNKNLRKLTKKMTKLPRENLILNLVEDPMTVHQTLMNVQTIIKFTTPKKKKGKIKSKKAKKDASQDDNNEQLEYTCDADVLCKEYSENYYKTTKKRDWLRCIMCQTWLHEDCTIFDIFCVDYGRKHRSINK
ncbi:hypothetical protein AVEN_250871-1 [Araneus ventricosus]|uniref:Uncharacterized protein n=1 Tax=Araneus ventricosus TaxID=182803 RepID=A0A4Y2IQJ5_ARAVE|nr:hypothetical protein AVEN_250871-1 [Araneus ventricosus]